MVEVARDFLFTGIHPTLHPWRGERRLRRYQNWVVVLQKLLEITRKPRASPPSNVSARR